MRHVATGNPRGRPRTIPKNFDKLVLASLKRRMDPVKHTVHPSWIKLRREFGVSRSTISRVIPLLKARGDLITIQEPIEGRKCCRVLYKIRT